VYRPIPGAHIFQGEAEGEQ